MTDSALNQLESKAQGELLDAIDRLRLSEQEFNRELNLPQLIVCGDQSSGKSSVLEAISRVRFPSHDVLCTRFVSELKLRSKPTLPEIVISVSIQAANYRSQEERTRLKAFKVENNLTKPEDLPTAIDEASKVLTELDPGRGIYEDKLIVSIEGPGLPNLTMVDLPGLIRASVKEDGQQDIDTVRRLVGSYMADPNSIILAVVAADNNFDNQEVWQLAKKVDERGERTIGIITKPDKVDAGSALERAGIDCARNLYIPLELGWHVLKNRGHTNKDVSADERDSLESSFFSQSSNWNWKELSDQHRGASTLRKKLSQVLLHAISKELPSLVNGIEKNVSKCLKILTTLGEPKRTDLEKRDILRAVSVDLREIVKDGIHGNYSTDASNPFFDHSAKKEEADRRFRTRLQDSMEEFADHMRTKSHLYSIVEDYKALPGSITSAVDLPVKGADIDITKIPDNISIGDMLETISEEKKKSRGCELHGIIPPTVIAKVFRAQSLKWDSIAELYINRCVESARQFFRAAVWHATPKTHVAQGIRSDILFPYFEGLKNRVASKRAELLKPYEASYLITPNKWDFKASIDQAKKRRAGSITADVEQRYSTELQIFDSVEAYYKIALNTFIENVANLVIENCLVTDLLDILTFESIREMSSTLVNRLTTEPPKVANDRRTTQRTLETLQSVLSICNKHVDRFGNVYPNSEWEVDEGPPEYRHEIDPPSMAPTVDDVSHPFYHPNQQSHLNVPIRPANNDNPTAPKGGRRDSVISNIATDWAAPIDTLPITQATDPTVSLQTDRKSSPRLLDADPFYHTPPKTPAEFSLLGDSKDSYRSTHVGITKPNRTGESPATRGRSPGTNPAIDYTWRSSFSPLKKEVALENEEARGD